MPRRCVYSDSRSVTIFPFTFSCLILTRYSKVISHFQLSYSFIRNAHFSRFATSVVRKNTLGTSFSITICHFFMPSSSCSSYCKLSITFPLQTALILKKIICVIVCVSLLGSVLSHTFVKNSFNVTLLCYIANN